MVNPVNTTILTTMFVLFLGIMWRKTIRGHDPSVFLSCSKDSTIYQHMFSDAHHPADHAPPVAISMNVNGDLSYAKCDKLTHVAPPTNVSKVYE